MGDHLKIDLVLIRATGEGLGRIKEAPQYENTDTELAKELTKHSSSGNGRTAS